VFPCIEKSIRIYRHDIVLFLRFGVPSPLHWFHSNSSNHLGTCGCQTNCAWQGPSKHSCMWQKSSKDIGPQVKRHPHDHLFWNLTVTSTLIMWCSLSKNPEKINEIIDRNIPSVIIIDGNNFISKSAGIYRRPQPIDETVGIYRRNISIGIYRRFRRRGIQFVWKYATAWWHQMILPTDLSRDSNWDSRTVTWHCHRRNHRRK